MSTNLKKQEMKIKYLEYDIEIRETDKGIEVLINNKPVYESSIDISIETSH